MRIFVLSTIISVLIIVNYQSVLCGGRSPQLWKRLLSKENPKHSRRIQIIKCCGGSKCSSSFKHKPPRRSSAPKSNNTTILKKASTPGLFQTTEATDFSGALENTNYENTTLSNIDTALSESNTVLSKSDTTPSVPNQKPTEITEKISSDQSITSSELTKSELTTTTTSQSDTTKIIAENTPPQTKAESTTDPPTSTSPAAEATTTLTIAATMTNLVTTIPTTISTSATTTTTRTATTTITTTTTTTKATTTSTSSTTTTSTSTTTTTAKPINLACELSRCENFTFIANQGASPVISASTSKLSVRNGTTFLFSSAAATQVDAAKNCFLRNLNLISVQDVLKLNLVQKLLQDIGADSSVWTIGSNEGNMSCQNYNLSFAWCNPKREIVLPAMMQKLNSLEIIQKGLTTSMLSGAAVLKTSDSNSMFPFLCEPNGDFQDSCLPLKCNKDNTMFDANGNIKATPKDGEKYGKWTRTCGKLYLFSNKLGTWQQSWDLCCNLGMHPIWFSSASDFECLSNATKAKWALNWNYWTAGRSMGTWGRWAWCPGAVNLPDSLPWAPGQPDNNQTNEDCLHLQVTKNSSGILLSDRNCSHKYVIACQGDALMASNCNKPNCSMECSRNESIFTNGTLDDLFVHGQWNAGCGKDYLFSNATMDWLGAWNYCCSVGMKLASIEALEELSCLTNMVAKYPRAVYPDQCGRDFWTSGTNRGCPGAHFWCSENEKLNKEELANWKNGKMPSESADQCIFINLSNSTLSETYLGADSCTKQKPFLCEALQPGTKSMQIERTCKEIWGVTDSEVIDIIMNPSGDVLNQRRNLKCYLRCCGKKGNVIKTGSLVTDQILRNLEDLTADDPQAMQNGFGNFDSCASFQSSDECNTTAQVFGCGKKNAPDLTIGLVTANKGDATVSVTATGGIKTGNRVCPVYPNCVPNQANIDEIKNTGSTLGAGVLTTSTGKKYFIKYVSGITDAQAEADYCCKLGSHLVIFESLEDYNIFMKEWPDSSDHWAFVGPTFDNGDGTDSWCSTFKKLPAGLITDINQYYRNQQFTTATRIYMTKAGGLSLYLTGLGCNRVICGPLPY